MSNIKSQELFTQHVAIGLYNRLIGFQENLFTQHVAIGLHNRLKCFQETLSTQHAAIGLYNRLMFPRDPIYPTCCHWLI